MVPLLDMYPDMEPRAGPIPVPAIGEYICRETIDHETRIRSTRPGPEPKSPPVKISFRPDRLRTLQNKGRKRAAGPIMSGVDSTGSESEQERKTCLVVQVQSLVSGPVH